MMFIIGEITEQLVPKKRFNPSILTEQEYFARNRDRLLDIQCPKCSDHNLFRGCVYIGCTGCMSYFSESEVIEANM